MTRPIRLQRRARAHLLCAPVFACALGAATAQAAPPPAADHCIVSDGAIGCHSERAITEITTPHKDAGTLQDLVRDKLASGECRRFDYGERVQLVSTDAPRAQIRRPGDKATYWMPSDWSRPAADCEGTPSASAMHEKLGLPTAPVDRTDEEDNLPDAAGDQAPAFADEDAPYAAPYRNPDFTDERRPPSRRDDDAYTIERRPAQRWRDDDAYAGERRPSPRRHDDDSAGGNRSSPHRHDEEDYRREDYDDDAPADAYRRRPPPPPHPLAWRSRPRPWPSHPLPSSRYAHRCDSDAMTDADWDACRNEQN